MLTLIDRQLFFGYVKSYVVCLVSLLSLYVIIDLFNNIDDFTSKQDEFLPTVQHIARYYGYQVTHIFDRLSESIVLLAAMFTVAWMQRNNELLPLLSAGVSTRRVIRPVLLGACVLVLLNVANQELLIPSLKPVPRDDPHGDSDVMVTAAYESNGIHLTGQVATRKEKEVRDFTCVIPETVANGNLVQLHAKQARYIPPGEDERSGGWLLTETKTTELPGRLPEDVLTQMSPGTFFLYTSEVDFDVLTRDKKWFYRISTWQLFDQLGKADSGRVASMAVFFHMRLTRPLLGMILVFMGLSIILRDQNRNVFISAGLCLLLCALFFASCYVAKYLGDKEMLAPALAAWLPVLVFGPLSFSLFDAIHT
jgi:lipopolysaccharide export system permease protein